MACGWPWSSIEMELSYPETGPIDIYDLGVPRDAKLVDRVPADDIRRVISEIKSSAERFEEHLALNVMSGRLARKFFPLSVAGILRDGLAALRGQLSHADPRHYNSVQRFAYLFVMADIALLVLSGLVLWKSVQFGHLRDLLGGYEFARRIHFFSMAALVGFIAIHLVMVALVPKTLLTMLVGGSARRAA